MKRASVLLVAFGSLASGIGTAQGAEGEAPAVPPVPEPDEVVAYRHTVDGGGEPVRLELELFLPEGHADSDARAAVVFFFGGGWNGGTTRQMRPFARHLAERGMVAACADYRVKSRHGTDPFACVEDAKAAVRYVHGPKANRACVSACWFRASRIASTCPSCSSVVLPDATPSLPQRGIALDRGNAASVVLRTCSDRPQTGAERPPRIAGPRQHP